MDFSWLKRMQRYFNSIFFESEIEQNVKESRSLFERKDQLEVTIKELKKELKKIKQKRKKPKRSGTNESFARYELLNAEIEKIEAEIESLLNEKDELYEKIWRNRAEYRTKVTSKMIEQTEDSARFINQAISDSRELIDKTERNPSVQDYKNRLEKIETIEAENINKFLNYPKEEISKLEPQVRESITVNLEETKKEMFGSLKEILYLEHELEEQIKKSIEQRNTWYERKTMTIEQNNEELTAHCQMRIETFSQSIVTFEAEFEEMKVQRQQLEEMHSKMDTIIEKFKTDDGV